VNPQTHTNSENKLRRRIKSQKQ